MKMRFRDVPEQFYGVGQWYEDFSQTSDKEVHRLVAEMDQREAPAAV
ncbi:MAG TPA: hypothetical protein VH207_11360 [Chthoniobacterales bacterium]|jgi:predicted phosphoribosyltransferase|nr:hypothetical protein [Chthoniobacterales bacterium]